MKLEELKVIVTGGASGMGAYFAQQFAEAGAQVAVGDVAEAGLTDLPSSVHTRRLDVTQSEACDGFVAWARDQMGGLNALINNAGIIRDGLLVRKDRHTGEILQMSDPQWQAVIDVNLTGTTYMTRAFVRTMVEEDRKPGVVVNMSSVARHGNRGQTNYVATKAAVAANAVTWAREFARFGIRVGAVAPGMIETPMTRDMNAKARDALVSMVPVGRIGVPHDIWLAVKFIVECDYFNGRCIDVDGGLVM
ncbi:MAG: SDR family NAD(P)-dependent oxidoreductase [Myxococcota bacterium]